MFHPYVIIIYTLFNIASIALLYHEFTFLIIIQAFFLLALYFKFETITTPIYQLIFCTETCKGKLWIHDDDDNHYYQSMGHNTDGNILTITIFILWFIFRPKYHKIFYEYNSPQDGTLLIQSVRIQKKYMKHYALKEGDEITIAYLKDKPQQSIPLIPPIIDVYQLNRYDENPQKPTTS